MKKSQRAAPRSIGANPALFVLATLGILATLGASVLAWREGGAELAWSLLLGLAAGLAGALGALATSMRGRRRNDGPVAALAQAMQAVRESHDYGRTVEIEADDEVGGLAAGFNDLLAEIGARDTAMAEHISGLEQAVAERAAEAQRAREDAEAAESARNDFLAAVSHEIRAPLHGVTAMAEMLAVGDLSPKQRRFAEVIAKSGATLLAIANDILDLSEIEAGKLEPQAATADPAEIVEDILALFWEPARSKGLDLAAHIDPTIPALIDTDPTRLRQVIGNLVNNAIQFTESGAVMVQVSVKGEVLRFSVRGAGVGMPKDQIVGRGLAISRRLAEAMGGRLFVSSEAGKGSTFAVDLPPRALAPAAPWPELAGTVVRMDVAGPATRAALSRYLQAAGATLAAAGAETGPIGLWVAEPPALRRAPRRAAPVICLGEYGDSAPHALLGAGLVDLVLVQPLRRRDIAAALGQLASAQPLTEALTARSHAETAALPTFHGRRVLAADDSAVNREVALEALARLGVETTLAADGRAAAEAALAEPFDLILMAASMPELDGYQAAEEIRRRQAEAGVTRTPILALIAQVRGAPAERWREAGMDGALAKPFTLAALAAGLGQFLAPGAPPASARPMVPTSFQATPLTATLGPTTASDLLDPQVTGELARLAAAGKGDFVERVRRLYRDNAPTAVKALIDASTNRDCEATARAAHALKSMSLNMGARLVAETAGRLEAQARDLKVVNVDQVQILHRQLLATLDVLEGYPPALYAMAAAGDGAAPEEQSLVTDLSAALHRDELSLVYQPQFDREGETITGIETLLRWNHPTRGFVSPALFIPIAERYGLIGKITRWVLSRAMTETADLGGFTIGFNASAVEFADPAFVDELAVLIARHGFDPKRLEIEVTETAVLAEEDEVRSNMARLHDLGLKIALDDFGVGYSSLSHLRLFPFDKLKIDRAFVIGCAENVQSATLVHAVVSIGRALGMKVVAEGVETEAQRKFLKVAGVHGMQGYLFAKPEPVEALRARLAAMKAPQAMSA